MLTDMKNYYPTRILVEKYKDHKIYKASEDFITARLEPIVQPVSFIEIEVWHVNDAFDFIFYSTFLTDLGVANQHSKEELLNMVLEEVRAAIDTKALQEGKILCFEFSGSGFFENHNQELINRLALLEKISEDYMN